MKFFVASVKVLQIARKTMPFTYFLLIGLLLLIGATEKPILPGKYGVDFSYPIHHSIDSTISPGRASYYQEQMAACGRYYTPRECTATERSRMEMALNQPKTQHNYTEIGFMTRKLPESLYDELLQFFRENIKEQHLESWPWGYTYVNTWESPTYMVSLEDHALRGGQDLKQRLWDQVQPIIEEWIGRKVTPMNLYGVRVYKDKAILAPHVDRLPLVSSCIINVDQDLDEPWPLELYDHQGRAHNVTLVPGDMLLYESHTVVHGRPFALRGRYYGNLLINYLPVDHEEMNKRDKAEAFKNSGGVLGMFGFNTLKQYKPPSLTGSRVGGHEQEQHSRRDIQKHLDAIDAEGKTID